MPASAHCDRRNHAPRLSTPEVTTFPDGEEAEALMAIAADVGHVVTATNRAAFERLERSSSRTRRATGSKLGRNGIAFPAAVQALAESL